MEIFLVRHGETSGNVARRHQAEHTDLTFKGEEQVREAAKIIKGYEPTHIVTSNLKRALDTAKVIGAECDLIPETQTYFAELRRPNKLYGNYHFTLSSIIYYFRWFAGSKHESIEDGETYDELLERIKKAKEYLATLPADARVIVVSHSVFISFFLAHLCDENKMNFLQAVKTFFRLVTMPNTQITHILFDSKEKVGTCSWIFDI